MAVQIIREASLSLPRHQRHRDGCHLGQRTVGFVFMMLVSWRELWSEADVWWSYDAEQSPQSPDHKFLFWKSLIFLREADRPSVHLVKPPSCFQDIRCIGTGVISIRGLSALCFRCWGDDATVDPKPKSCENHLGSLKKSCETLEK
jgi:hypothetical protein